MIGARYIELEIWENKDVDYPYVQWGQLQTAKINLQTVLESIKVKAFEVNPLPLFINADCRCSKRRQLAILQIFESTLGDLIYKSKFEEFQQETKLPTLEQLQRKIILTGMVRVQNCVNFSDLHEKEESHQTNGEINEKKGLFDMVKESNLSEMVYKSNILMTTTKTKK
jgi:hypothetical protein